MAQHPKRSASTSPARALAARAAELDLVLPGDGGALSDVLPAVADAFGVPTVPGAARRRREWGVPTGERVCVVLVDGLGLGNLTERSGHAPFLRARLDDARALSCGYPSTTAASMGSFGTGTNPGRTGMVGYTVRHPGTGKLANLVSWDGVGPAREWQTVPTVFEQLVAADVAVTSVGPARFAGSGMTEAALRGSRYQPAESLTGRVDGAVQALVRPGLVYLYWGEVDKAGHHHGWGSWQWGEELSALDGELARLVRSVPRGTTILLTADHGMVDVDRTRRWDVATDALLGQGVAVVAGEPRAMHVHAETGTAPAEIADRWRTVLGNDALVLLGDDAVATGLFGPVAEHVRPLIGDVVVAMAGRSTVVDSRTQTSASLELIGVHGSLTALETQVPLLVVTT
ncbi:alkaline phosphatase family protein [Cellulomonas hominis]